MGTLAATTHLLVCLISSIPDGKVAFSDEERENCGRMFRSGVACDLVAAKLLDEFRFFTPVCIPIDEDKVGGNL
jgi:hypothetical protein